MTHLLAAFLLVGVVVRSTADKPEPPAIFRTLLREFSAPQPKGMQSFFYSGFQVLPSGNLVQANWNGHDDRDYTHGLKLFEFNCAGEVVWSWIAPKEQAGSILTFLILDGLDLQQPHDDTTGTQQPFPDKQ